MIPTKEIFTILERLEKKVDKISECTQTIITNSQPQISLHTTKMQDGYLVDLVEDILELEDYESILETLNQEGNSEGYSYKKGQNYMKNKIVLAKTIVCKYYNRNIDKQKSGKDNLDEDMDDIPWNEKKLVI